jgi:hypothetical protein
MKQTVTLNLWGAVLTAEVDIDLQEANDVALAAAYTNRRTAKRGVVRAKILQTTVTETNRQYIEGQGVDLTEFVKWFATQSGGYLIHDRLDEPCYLWDACFLLKQRMKDFKRLFVSVHPAPEIQG